MRETVKLDATTERITDEPMVNVFIPADDNIKDPNYQYVEVGLNGKMYLVGRGQSVPVPVPVYEVLKLSGRYPLSA
jgi:hypothetical protein